MTPEEQALRDRARRLVTAAVRKGTLVRPSECECCSSTQDIEAHHADYAKPLEVRWLARECHVREHNRIRVPNDRGIAERLEYNRRRKQAIADRRARRRLISDYARSRLAEEAPDRTARKRLAAALGCTDAHLSNIVGGWAGVGDVLLDALRDHWAISYEDMDLLAQRWAAGLSLKPAGVDWSADTEPLPAPTLPLYQCAEEWL